MSSNPEGVNHILEGEKKKVIYSIENIIMGHSRPNLHTHVQRENNHSGRDILWSEREGAITVKAIATRIIISDVIHYLDDKKINRQKVYFNCDKLAQECNGEVFAFLLNELELKKVAKEKRQDDR